jgi:hypothetical protein
MECAGLSFFHDQERMPPEEKRLRLVVLNNFRRACFQRPGVLPGEAKLVSKLTEKKLSNGRHFLR